MFKDTAYLTNALEQWDCSLHADYRGSGREPPQPPFPRAEGPCLRQAEAAPLLRQRWGAAVTAPISEVAPESEPWPLHRTDGRQPAQARWCCSKDTGHLLRAVRRGCRQVTCQRSARGTSAQGSGVCVGPGQLPSVLAHPERVNKWFPLQSLQ